MSERWPSGTVDETIPEKGWQPRQPPLRPERDGSPDARAGGTTSNLLTPDSPTDGLLARRYDERGVPLQQGFTRLVNLMNDPEGRSPCHPRPR